MTTTPYYADAALARDQLRDLAVRGFPATWLADQIDATPSGLDNIRAGRVATTHHYLARSIGRLYQQLDGTTGPDHHIPEGLAQITRLTAARRGWGTAATTTPTRKDTP